MLTGKRHLSNDDRLELIVSRTVRGWTPEEVADSLKLTVAEVIVELASHKAQTRLLELRSGVFSSLADLRGRLRELSSAALERAAQLGGLVDGEMASLDDSVRLRAAFGILDRAGYGPNATIAVETKQPLAVFYTEKDEPPEDPALVEEFQKRVKALQTATTEALQNETDSTEQKAE